MNKAKRNRVLAVSALVTLLLPALSFAEQPSFYHYYYVYGDSMERCGKLVQEVFKNTNRNWRFTKKKLTDTTASFSVGDVRGALRCLAKKSDESWVVIIATGNNSRKTKDLFEELRVGVCGECSAWVD